MTTLPRRKFLLGAGGGVAGALTFSGSLATVLGPAAGAQAPGRGRTPGYGPLVPDPAGILDLPAGFRYVAFSQVGTDVLDDGRPVPGSHDGMAAFSGRRGRTMLVRNHEVSPEDVEGTGPFRSRTSTATPTTRRAPAARPRWSSTASGS